MSTARDFDLVNEEREQHELMVLESLQTLGVTASAFPREYRLEVDGIRVIGPTLTLALLYLLDKLLEQRRKALGLP